MVFLNELQTFLESLMDVPLLTPEYSKMMEWHQRLSNILIEDPISAAEFRDLLTGVEYDDPSFHRYYNQHLTTLKEYYPDEPLEYRYIVERPYDFMGASNPPSYVTKELVVTVQDSFDLYFDEEPVRDPREIKKGWIIAGGIVCLVVFFVVIAVVVKSLN